jgi:hypothetical protein
MASLSSNPPLRTFAKVALGLELFLSIGALGGGAALMVGPRGEILPLPLSVLEGSAFNTYFVPGLILFCVLGLGPLAAAFLVWSRHPLAPIGVSVVGAALLIWMAVEIIIVGYSNHPPLQPFYLLLAVVITVFGLAWRSMLRREARRVAPPRTAGATARE